MATMGQTIYGVGAAQPRGVVGWRRCSTLTM